MDVIRYHPDSNNGAAQFFQDTGDVSRHGIAHLSGKESPAAVLGAEDQVEGYPSQRLRHNKPPGWYGTPLGCGLCSCFLMSPAILAGLWCLTPSGWFFRFPAGIPGTPTGCYVIARGFNPGKLRINQPLSSTPTGCHISARGLTPGS